VFVINIEFDGELLEQLEARIQKERAYLDRFETDAPGDVDALGHADYGSLEPVWQDLQEWETVRRRIRELERARQRRGDDTQALA
jgi:hypothetical protein